MIRYAVYARKSHDDTDVTAKSLADQVAVWRDLARELKLDVGKEYEESKSAKTAGIRPQFDAMIRQIKRGEINGILTWNINRLARNMTEGGLLADLLIKGLIQEIRTPHEVFRQQDNILPLVLQQATATQNNRDHTEAVLRGVSSKFASGGWTHRAPAGYLNQRDTYNSKRGVVVPDPERFQQLRNAWEMLLTGAHSVEDVIATLNGSWGFRTRQTPKRGGTAMARSHGYKIFSDIFYAGYQRRVGRIEKGSHVPMVTLKEFHRAQEILSQRGKSRRTTKGRKKRTFPFTGLIRCGSCGQQVTADVHAKNGREYVYYHCSDSYRQCTKRGLRQDRIEEQVLMLLEGVTVDADLCKLAVENIDRWLGRRSADSEQSYGNLHRNLESVESQLNNLLGLRLREVIGDDVLYRQKEAELVTERNRLKLAMQEAEEELEHQRQTFKNGFAYLSFARDHYLIADIETKKQLARAMGIEYVLTGNVLSITVDPLLKQLVKFAEGIKVTLETGKMGSQSRYNASICLEKSFGRTTGTLFELIAPLREQLTGRSFPRLEFPGGSLSDARRLAAQTVQPQHPGIAK